MNDPDGSAPIGKFSPSPRILICVHTTNKDCLLLLLLLLGAGRVVWMNATALL